MKSAGAKRPGEDPPARPLLGGWGIAGLGIFLLLVGVLMGAILVGLWPIVEKVAAGETGSQQLSMLWGQIELDVSPDTSFLLLVIVASGIGSFVHAATSFTTYVGNRDLSPSWVWWYLLRVFIGMTLALLFYFAIRGGFFAQDAATEQVNPYGIAALAGLTGLFSKQATDKLREVFDTLFRTAPGAGDDQRKDKLSNPVPQLGEVVPSTVEVGTTSREIRVRGRDFVAASVVRVDGSDRQTRFVGPEELLATLSEADVAGPGDREVTVFNPEPGGGTTKSVLLRVVAAPPS